MAAGLCIEAVRKLNRRRANEIRIFQGLPQRGGNMNCNRWLGVSRQTLSCAATLAVMFTITASANAQRGDSDFSSRRALSSAHRISNSQPVPKIATANSSNAKYKVVPIGVLPGKTATILDEPGKPLNNFGHVVGWSYTQDANRPYQSAQPFIWKDGKLTPLPLLDGFTSADASGINDRDQVVGTAAKIDSGIRINRAVLWDHGKAMDLGLLEPNSRSQAYSLNFWGTIVGYSHNLTDGSNTAIVWYGGVIHALPFLPGQAGSVAFAINDFGVIAGIQYPADQSSENPCLWYWNGTGYAALSLRNLGTGEGWATGINNWGQAVGYDGVDPDSPEAILWDWKGAHPLPLFPGDSYGDAIAINDSVQVVGFSENRVLIWDNGTVNDLQSMVPPDTPQLLDVQSINRLGQITVGTGSEDDGSLRGYLLLPKDK